MGGVDGHSRRLVGLHIVWTLHQRRSKIQAILSGINLYYWLIFSKSSFNYILSPRQRPMHTETVLLGVESTYQMELRAPCRRPRTRIKTFLEWCLWGHDNIAIRIHEHRPSISNFAWFSTEYSVPISTFSYAHSYGLTVYWKTCSDKWLIFNIMSILTLLDTFKLRSAWPRWSAKHSLHT